MNTGKHKIKDNITEKDRNLCSCKRTHGLIILYTWFDFFGNLALKI